MPQCPIDPKVQLVPFIEDVTAQAISGITTANSIGKRIIDVLKLKRTRP